MTAAAATGGGRLPALAAPLALCLLVAALFVTGAPVGGAFSWPDSPRHALNGAFILDLFAAAPFGDPMGYAFGYYTQYPALTIGFYPPLFSFLLVPFYALLGVSQASAVVALGVCYAFFACGTYALARNWLTPTLSLGVAATLAVMPEIAFWGRQVMLEVPSFAFLVWSAHFLVRHLRERRIGPLYAAVFLLVLAMYTKISVAFVAPVYLLALLQARGLALFRDRHSYIIAALAVVGLVPLVAMTLKFGQANVQSTVGIADSEVSRLSLSGWMWYAARLPEQMGWPALAAALAAVVVLLADAGARARLLRDHLLWVAWFLVGYLFFSAIDLKEARHSVYLLLPLALFIGFAGQALSRRRRWLGEAVLAVVAVATLAITQFTRPVLFVDGYRDVVRFIAEVAPRDSNVLFSGYRDGSFIFEMRADAQRPDMSVIRADKLLLRIAVRRGLGVEQQAYTETEIADLVGRLGVHYVVAQPDFWTDLEQMRRLQAVLHGAGFAEVRRFPMTANYPAQERELVVYRNLGPVASGPIDITNELPIIDGAISGTVSDGDGPRPSP